MSGALDQFIGAVEKGDFHDAATTAGKMLSDEAQSTSASASSLGQEVSNISASIHLPDLHLTAASDAPAAPVSQTAPARACSEPDGWTQFTNVAKQFGDGVVNEAEHHPLQLVESAAVGLATGVAIGAGATALVAAGVFTAPEIAVVGGVDLAGTALIGAVDAFDNRAAIEHNTAVVANPDAYSAQDVAQARQSVQDFGGQTLNFGVGMAAGLPGAMGGSYLASAAIDALTPAATIAATTADSALADDASAAMPKIDLANPTSNTNAPALKAAFDQAIVNGRATGQPVSFNLDDSVSMTDASGKPTGLTQSDILYQSYEDASPANLSVSNRSPTDSSALRGLSSNRAAVSDRGLYPPDPGYSEGQSSLDINDYRAMR